MKQPDRAAIEPGEGGGGRSGGPKYNGFSAKVIKGEEGGMKTKNGGSKTAFSPHLLRRAIVLQG